MLSDFEAKEEIHSNIRKLVDAYKPDVPGDSSSIKLFNPKDRLNQSNSGQGALSVLSEQRIRESAV